MYNVNKQAEVAGISCLKQLNCSHQGTQEALTNVRLCKEKRINYFTCQKSKQSAK